MKPRYVVINQNERDSFEKEWQLPYGYGFCPIYYDPQEAIEMLEVFVQSNLADENDWIVEEITEEGRVLYYRM
jgi:hypothetical protein